MERLLTFGEPDFAQALSEGCHDLHRIPRGPAAEKSDGWRLGICMKWPSGSTAKKRDKLTSLHVRPLLKAT